MIARVVTTDELWTKAVKRIPIRRTRKMLWMLERNSTTSGSLAKSSMDVAIIIKPTKRRPKPAITPPQTLVFSFLENAMTNAPIPARAAKMTERDNVSSLNIPIAAI